MKDNASIVLARSNKSSESEFCSTCAEKCTSEVSPKQEHIRHTFHASCSVIGARAVDGSLGDEWKRCGFLSRKSLSAKRFFWITMRVLLETANCWVSVGLGRTYRHYMKQLNFEHTHPGLVNLDFHIGRTNRAKYRENPSRLPLKIAVPWLSAV